MIPGSIGHYHQDAATVASWGTDYIKVRDGCVSRVTLPSLTMCNVLSFISALLTMVCACHQLDWCGTTNLKAPPYILNQQNATTGFAAAANATGRPMWLNFHCDHLSGNIPDVRHTSFLFSQFCVAPPARTTPSQMTLRLLCTVCQWCPQDGNSWRMAEDHHDNWSDTIQVINNLKLLAPFAGPTRWNDPDFLMTGGAGCDKNVTGLRCPGQTDTE